jgi:hypothetical protein
MEKLTQNDANTIRVIIAAWNVVSNDAKAYDYMTDHCHDLYQEGLELVDKIERIANADI